MADQLPLGFINDDDKLRRHDSWRREEKHHRELQTSMQAPVHISHPVKYLWECGGGEMMSGVYWVTRQQHSLNNSRNSRKVKELRSLTSEIF
jgi:hypothetical protein